MRAKGLSGAGFVRTLEAGALRYDYASLDAAQALIGDVSRAPKTLLIILENLIRFHDGSEQGAELIRDVAADGGRARTKAEIEFRPARILSQDLAGVPLIVDLAALRDAVARFGGDPLRVNPTIPVDFVIDHSIMVDSFAAADSLARNMAIERERNGERFAFLRWAGGAFRNVRLVPPGKGICHQVNLERLAEVVRAERVAGRAPLVFPDTVLGTDSHTPMINGLGVLGWGAGGAEAELAMLGESVAMSTPEIVGVRLVGDIREGVLPTDVVLTLTQTLREAGVVGRFVEFFGPGVARLGVPERATIANMAPEYGAATGYFAIDAQTINYLHITGRSQTIVDRVEAYARAQHLWAELNAPEPDFGRVVDFDLSKVARTVAGPDRPDQRRSLADAAASLPAPVNAPAATEMRVMHGDIVIAAITSCTNTSNPRAMIAAGLLAKRACALRLKRRTSVKTSFAPGSQAVSRYLEEAELQVWLSELGFDVVGYGCTTCIGNSGDLAPEIRAAIRASQTTAVAVLSGNRNFQGRVNPDVKASYLCSPALVVAYALAGSILTDLENEPIGFGRNGVPVYLEDIWPSNAEIDRVIARHVRADQFTSAYADLSWRGEWSDAPITNAATFGWQEASTFISEPPYFDDVARAPAPSGDIVGARVLLSVGDAFTTDHISPAGQIASGSPAARYLADRGVAEADYGTYGARRGSADVMVRGTFSNAHIRNELVAGLSGGESAHAPSGQRGSVFDIAQVYRADATPLIIVAGRAYGTGSSRDWAAKGTKLLGVRAVIAESFERIHRANLVHAAVLPLMLKPPLTRGDLNLRGDEFFNIRDLASLRPRQSLFVELVRAGGEVSLIEVVACVETAQELEFLRHGGLLPYAMRRCLEPDRGAQ